MDKEATNPKANIKIVDTT